MSYTTKQTRMIERIPKDTGYTSNTIWYRHPVEGRVSSWTKFPLSQKPRYPQILFTDSSPHYGVVKYECTNIRIWYYTNIFTVTPPEIREEEKKTKSKKQFIPPSRFILSRRPPTVLTNFSNSLVLFPPRSSEEARDVSILFCHLNRDCSGTKKVSHVEKEIIPSTEL